jgi:hypothetical protein
MSKLRLFGYVVLNTLTAVFGTAVLESSLPHVFHPRSGSEVIWRVWITSSILSALLGILATRFRIAKAAGWAWLIPAFVLAGRALIYLSRGGVRFAFLFSGYDCAVGLGKSDCNEFFVFTLPLIRGLSYSAAARVALRFSARSEEVTDRPI